MSYELSNLSYFGVKDMRICQKGKQKIWIGENCLIYLNVILYPAQCGQAK